jgi:hypothetical protein
MWIFLNTSVADPHPHGSAWFWSGSASGSSYSKISAEIWITNTIINIILHFQTFCSLSKNLITFKVWTILILSHKDICTCSGKYNIYQHISWLAIVQ